MKVASSGTDDEIGTKKKMHNNINVGEILSTNTAGSFAAKRYLYFSTTSKCLYDWMACLTF